MGKRKQEKKGKMKKDKEIWRNEERKNMEN